MKWLPKACLSHPRHQSFYTVRHFIEGEGMQESGDLTIREWRERLSAKQPMNGITPPEVAANLRRHAETAKRTVVELRQIQGANKELRLTLGDIEAFACLGFRYAAKIEGVRFRPSRADRGRRSLDIARLRLEAVIRNLEHEDDRALQAEYPRLMLHASALTFRHPSGRPITVESPPNGVTSDI